MKPYYKLTDKDMKTRTGKYNEHQWELGKKHEIAKYFQCENEDLCTSSWFHVYSSPLLAVLLNPIHAKIQNPRLFKCTCSGIHRKEHDLKEGFTEVKLISEIELPKISLIQKTAFSILCAQKVFKNKKWNNWAKNWLNNNDRTSSAAYVASRAAEAAYYTAYAAACAAIYAVAYEADHAASYAARAAHESTYAASKMEVHLDLIKLAEEAMKY